MPKASALCKLCSLDTTEDLLHALISCPGNVGVGRKVVDCVTDHVLAESDLHLLRLDFQAEEAHELPVVWFLAVSWLSMWEARSKGRRPELYKVRAELEAKVSLLRETRVHQNSAEIITSMLCKLVSYN